MEKDNFDIEDNFNIEDSFKSLDEIIKKLEEGPTLEESIRLYKEGISQVKKCNDKLTDIDGQLKRIKEEEGEL